jgi:hypothetical protein
LCLWLNNEGPSYEDVWRIEGIGPSFVTSALDGGVRSASNPSCFNSGERSSWYPLDRRPIGFQTRFRCCGEETPFPCRELHPGNLAHIPSLYRLSYHWQEIISQSCNNCLYLRTGIINILQKRRLEDIRK